MAINWDMANNQFGLGICFPVFLIIAQLLGPPPPYTNDCKSASTLEQYLQTMDFPANTHNFPANTSNYRRAMVITTMTPTLGMCMYTSNFRIVMGQQ